MTRDEIRKKWQNGEFVGKQSEDNIAEGTQLRPTNQRVQEEPKNVWQQVMDRTEQMMNMNSKIANQEMADSNKKTVKDNIWHVAKRTGAGIFSTLTGQVSGAVTDTANQLQKGEKRSKGAALLNAADTLLAPDNVNIMNATREANRENIEILKDKDKNAWEKLAGVAMNTTSSAINAMPFKRKTNAVIQAVGSIFKDKELSKEALKANDAIRKPSQEFNQRLAEESKEYGRGTRIAGDVMQTVGGMVPSMVSSAVTGDPTASLLSLGLGAKGNATNEALDKGVSLEDAVKRGDTDMMIEIGTEKLSSGVNIFGKGALDKVNDKMMKSITSKVGRFLAKEGLDIAEENLEEVVSDVAGNLLDKGTTDPDAEIWNWGDELKTIGLTTLTTTVLKILTGGHLQDYNEISRELQSEFEKENGTKNINQEQNDVEDQKNTEPEEKQATTIENKPLLQQEQQTIQEETKKAENENTEQTEEIEEKEEEKPKSLLIKPKLDNELNKERAKNILDSIKRKEEYKSKAEERKIKANEKKAQEQIKNESFIHKKQSERDKLGEGKITGETNESYEVTFEKKDENGNNIVKKYSKERFNEFFDKVGEETVKEEKPKAQKLPETKPKVEQKAKPKTDAEMIDYMNEIDRRENNAKKAIKEQEQTEKENAIENKELNTIEEEERQRRYEKEDVKEYNKKQKEEGKEYAGNDDSFDKTRDYDRLDRINKKTLKKDNIRKSLDKALDNEEFRKEITKRGNISGKNYTLTKEDIYEDAGHLNNAINYMFEQNKANKEARLLEQNDVQELLKQDSAAYDEFDNEYNQRIQQAVQNNEEQDTGTTRREVNKALDEKVDNEDVETLDTTDMDKGKIETPTQELPQQAKQNNQEPTTEELNDISRQQRNERKQQRKETWQETRDRETRDFFEIDEESWNNLSEERKWGYRNRYKNSSDQEIDSNIRNKSVEKAEQMLEESNKALEEDDVIGILDGEVTAENLEEKDAERKVTARELWEEYKRNELKMNNKNDDLTFVTFDDNRVSSNEDKFNAYLDLVSPERFVSDLKKAVEEKNKTNFKETFGIKQSVYDKALNVKDSNQLAENNEIISALASNDDTYKLRVLNDLGNKDIVSKEDFRKNFNRRSRTPGSKNIEYNRYLDEKLRRLVYDKVNEKYDIADEFTQEEVRRIRDLETKVRVHKTIADRYREIVDTFLNGKTNKTGRNLKPTDIKERVVTTNPDGKLAKLRKLTKAISFYANTPERVNEIAFDHDTANIIQNEFFDPLNKSLADKNRFVSDVVKVMDDFGISDGTEDSKLLFELVDGVEYDDNGSPIGGFNETLLRKRLGNDEARINRILEARKIVDNVLSNILDRANAVLKDNGFPEIPRRKNYITHSFKQYENAITEYLPKIVGNESQENKTQAVLDLFKSSSTSISNTENNDINNEGSEVIRPTSPNEKQRTGKMTETDAIKSVKTYAQSMSNIIYLTEHVQKLRALEKLLRQTAQLEGSGYEDAVYDFENLSNEEKLQMEATRLTNGFEEYTNWLHSYINSLVGAKKEIKTDVPLLNTILNIGSEGLNKISGKLGANAVGYNMVTPFTNLIPAAKTIAQTNPISNMKAIGQMVGETLGFLDDGVLDDSDLWTRRQGIDLKLNNKTFGETVRDIGMKPMNFADDVATEFILRAKYNEALSNFKRASKKNGTLADADNIRSRALAYADDFAARTLAERTTGRTPLMFGSSILKPFTQFQIEPTNEAVGYIHDMKERFTKDKELFGYSDARSAANIAASGASMLVMSQIFNNAFEAAFGSRPAIDLMEVIKIALGYDVEPDEDDEEKNKLVSALKYLAGFSEEKNDKDVQQRLSEAGAELWSYVPIVNQLQKNARVPTFGAFSDIKEGITDFATNIAKEDGKGKAMLGLKTAAKNYGKYFFLPAGGIQANRILETAATFKRGGNYADTGELRYPVQEQDKTPVRQTQALLFGRKNLPTAKEYNQRYKNSLSGGAKYGKGKLSQEDTELYNSLEGVSYKDFTKVIDNPSSGRMNMLNNIDASESDKWKLFTNKVLSDKQGEKATAVVDNGLATKEEVMNNYEEFKERDISIPNEETIKKMKENDISFDLYSKYENDLKNMQDEQARIKNTTLLLTGKDISKEKDEKDDFNADEGAKIEIIRNDKYSDDEREKLYTTLVLGNGENADKSRKNYEDFKKFGANNSSEINKYFDWKQSGYASAGKKDEVLAWMNNHGLTQDQKTFLMSKKQYKLTNAQKKLLESNGVELSKRYK